MTPILTPIAFGATALIAGLAATTAAACPDWTLSGAPISYSSEQLWAPQSVDVVAGGNVNLTNCPMPGHGYVITQPDFDLTFTDNEARRDLEIRVQAPCDTVLLVNDAQGNWHFSDDEGGNLNPLLRLTAAPAGAYDIWVGTFDTQTCPATLTFETFGTPPGAAAAPVAPGNLTHYRGQIGQTLSFTVTGSSGGSVWGSGVYTDDSSVAAAAVHAGVQQAGQTGVVEVTILPGHASYQGSAANGVTSSNYGSWSGSFSFPAAPAPAAPAASK